jgi:hypothetical protein
MTSTSVIGVFDSEKKIVRAIEQLKARQYQFDEAYTPYPVHEVLHATGKKSRMPVAAWLYGFFGGAAVLAFLYYTAVISWPLNYGGKPFNTFPSFIVITLILIIFIVTIMSLFTFSARARIYPLKKPVIIDERASDDKFILLFEMTNRKEEESLEIQEIMKNAEASEVYQKDLKK